MVFQDQYQISFNGNASHRPMQACLNVVFALASALPGAL